jgi:hypothetical protein
MADVEHALKFMIKFVAIPELLLLPAQGLTFGCAEIAFFHHHVEFSIS